MALDGFHTLSIYDDGDDAASTTAGTVLQMNNLANDQGDMTIQQPLEEQRNPLNEVVYSGEHNAIEIAVYEDNIIDQIRQWQKANRRLQMVGVGWQKGLLWYHPTRFRIEPKNHFAAGSRDMRIIKAEVDAAGLPIGTGVNILTLANKLVNNLDDGWSDSDNDGVADGFSTLNGQNYAFASSTLKQYYDADASGGRVIAPAIPLPISGIELTIAVSLNEYTSSSGAHRLQVELYDYDGNSLLSEYDDRTSTGKNTRTVTMPNNIYSIGKEGNYNWHISRIVNGSSGDSVGIDRPVIRADGSSEWTSI